MSRSHGWVWACALTLSTACGNVTNVIVIPPAELSVSCPANQFPSGYGPMAVTYPAATITGGTAPVSVVATPTSGSMFQPGQTTVNIEARSADGQVKNCSFVVTVSLPPPPPKATLVLASPSQDTIYVGQYPRLTPSCSIGTTTISFPIWPDGSNASNGIALFPGKLKYGYDCVGPGGSDTAWVTVTVLDVPPAGARATRNRPDETPGLRELKYVYALPSDGVDRGLDTNGVLQNSILSAQHWLAEQTGMVERPDNYQGKPDILFFRSSWTEAQLTADGTMGPLSRQLANAGLYDSINVYVFYYEGRDSPYCALGANGTAILYLKCDNLFASSPTAPPGAWEFDVLHEVFHALGAVDPRAPDHCTASPGHVNNPLDLMFGGGCPGGWNPSVIDPTGRNYFGDNVPPGVLNTKRDPIFITAPASIMAKTRIQTQATMRTSPPPVLPSLVNDFIRP